MAERLNRKCGIISAFKVTSSLKILCYNDYSSMSRRNHIQCTFLFFSLLFFFSCTSVQQNSSSPETSELTITIQEPSVEDRESSTGFASLKETDEVITFSMEEIEEGKFSDNAKNELAQGSIEKIEIAIEEIQKDNLKDETDAMKSSVSVLPIKRSESPDISNENVMHEENLVTERTEKIEKKDDFENLKTEHIVSGNTVEHIERLYMTPDIMMSIVIVILIIIGLILYKKFRNTKEDLIHEQARSRRLGINNIEEAGKLLDNLKKEIETCKTEIRNLSLKIDSSKEEKSSLEEKNAKLTRSLENQKRKLSRFKELYAAVEHAVERFHETEIPEEYLRRLSDEEKKDLDTIAPSVMLNLNSMSYQDLRKEFRANQKQIDALLENYAKRYTTKANQAIYKLMVISLRAELQNILYNLKYEKLERALEQVKSLIEKYLAIVSEGNQQIAGTARRFIGELEHLFENAVRIEYEYYIKKEQVRQEQLALRQQMREEAEERRRLKEQQKQVAFEESKYKAEITKIRKMLEQEPSDSSKHADIMLKLEELTTELNHVEEKKEEITRLQNGKAGNVYIISNLGSFGDHIFKIGMTRRLDPQERINELGSASVPFKFDVHSFIFSTDAVGLENELHRRLHTRRVNKVNLRKEFFDISLDELEQLVAEINPAAEFNRTMLAEDYKQSLSMQGHDIPEIDLSGSEDIDDGEDNSD